MTRVQRYLFELLAPRKYRRMVNRKLEDAARRDEEDREWEGFMARTSAFALALGNIATSTSFDTTSSSH